MMMEPEICFICGVRISRGNRSEIPPQEKMDKLVSVSNTVEHSSTIISDILSRILNETVLREEIVCRICFNLLNDIDYHLKVCTVAISCRTSRQVPGTYPTAQAPVDDRIADPDPHWICIHGDA